MGLIFNLYVLKNDRYCFLAFIQENIASQLTSGTLCRLSASHFVNKWPPCSYKGNHEFWVTFMAVLRPGSGVMVASYWYRKTNNCGLPYLAVDVAVRATSSAVFFEHVQKIVLHCRACQSV